MVNLGYRIGRRGVKRGFLGRPGLQRQLRRDQGESSFYNVFLCGITNESKPTFKISLHLLEHPNVPGDFYPPLPPKDKIGAIQSNMIAGITPAIIQRLEAAILQLTQVLLVHILFAGVGEPEPLR